MPSLESEESKPDAIRFIVLKKQITNLKLVNKEVSRRVNSSPVFG